MSSHLITIDPSSPCDHEPIAHTFGFPLDPFQKHAIKAIDQGHNVLVTAKTGSGKTLVAEYQLYKTVKNGGRVFYTTPIKSLSNQKFHDLKALFPSVGILTGDIKYKPDAQILIMTTEILRNLLYKQNTNTASIGLTASISLDGLEAVIFDEVHYINDRERGKVWEETMILLDPKIQLVLLSATIDRPDLFASWLGDLKQVPIHLISTLYRIVPLEHQVMQFIQPQTIMDSKDTFNDVVYNKWIQWRQSVKADKANHQRQVVARKKGGYEDPVVKRDQVLHSFPHQLNEMVTYLQKTNLMPALFFVFSRAGCEKFARTVEGSLISTSESATIENIWNFHLHRYKDVLEKLPQAHHLLDLVKRGIAYHHSGLLPLLREMVEILFGKGLIKCLFATETFAVGINMPTKTVVFLDLEKYSDETNGLRILRTDEYIQMAGRAGRRGKDTKGHVFYLPQREPLETNEMKLMMTGRKTPITSRMDFGYDFLLKTLHSSNHRWLDIMNRSYWHQQKEAEKEGSVRTIADLEKRIASLGLTDETIKLCEERVLVEQKMKTSVNAAKRLAQAEYEKMKNLWLSKQALWDSWTIYCLLQDELQGERVYLANLEVLSESLVEPKLQMLRSWGFLAGDTLTDLGNLATEINEGHPILMAKAFQTGLCDDFTGEEIVAFLAAFLGEGKDESPPLGKIAIPQKVKDALWTVSDLATEYMKEDQSDFWDLQTTWIELAYRWVQGEDASVLARDYDTYEGNMMRTLLKMANLVEEWTNLATFTQNIKMLEKMEGLKDKIVRGLAKPESLYLTLQ